MYQYPYTEAPSESSQLPFWLSNYYSNREAGLFGSEADNFFASRPVFTYSEQASQNPMSYSSMDFPRRRSFDTNAPSMEDIENAGKEAGTVNSWADWASALATGLGIVANPVAGMFGLGLNMALGRNATNMSTFDALASELASEFESQTGYAATPSGIEAAATNNRGTWGAFADFFGFGEDISDMDIDYEDIADITGIADDVTESGEGAATSWGDAVDGLADGIGANEAEGGIDYSGEVGGPGGDVSGGYGDYSSGDYSDSDAGGFGDASDW